MIVCHEKVARIPLEGDEILRVHGERTQGVVKTLMNTKVDEQKLSDISIIQDLLMCFRKMTMSPQQRKSEFRGRLSQGARRELNKLTIKNRYLLPRIDDLFDQLRGGVSFLKDRFSFRLSSATSACGAILRRIFERRYEHFESTVMPFGDGDHEVHLKISVGVTEEGEVVAVVYGQRIGVACSLMELDYAGQRRKPLNYEVRRCVMLKVSPWKGVVHFGKKSKLAPRYVGPFEILKRIGPVAYRLRLSEELSGLHDTFHGSYKCLTTKKCLADASLHVPLDEIKVDKTPFFVEEPVEIMDREIKSLKHSKISPVKVRWNSKCGPEFTWEREEYMKSKYPQLFVDRTVEPTS
ncbi:hypothetical protein Tco_0494844 [Tanacetum coccineum]